VARNRPTRISKSGKTRSMQRDFLSRIYIKVFFFSKTHRWEKKTFFSESFEMEYSSRRFSSFSSSVMSLEDTFNEVGSVVTALSFGF
jgi:hypothetical protein